MVPPIPRGLQQGSRWLQEAHGARPRLRWSRQAPHAPGETEAPGRQVSPLHPPKAPALKGPKTLKCFQGSLIRQLIPIRKPPGAVRSMAHPIPERCANILPCPALPPPSLLPLTSRPAAWAGEHQLKLTSLRFSLSQFPTEVSLPLFQESLPAQWKAQWEVS